MKRRQLAVLGLLVTNAAVFVAACGHAGPSAEDRLSSLTLVNSSDIPICEVYLARRSQGTWGADRLTGDEAVPPGSAHTFYLPSGRWSVRLKDCDGSPLYARHGVVVRGSKRLEFQVIEVNHDQLWFGRRRFAASENNRM